MIKCEEIAFIEEMVKQYASISASPGFTWGESGNVSANSFLLNDGVPSNRSGRLVPLKNGFLKDIFVLNEINNNFDVQLLKRTGAGPNIGAFTQLALVSLVGQRFKSFGIADFGDISLAFEDELAMRVINGSAKNIVCGVIIIGTTE